MKPELLLVSVAEPRRAIYSARTQATCATRQVLKHRLYQNSCSQGLQVRATVELITVYSRRACVYRARAVGA